MKILSVAQGTPEWHAARDTHFCASDAPAMLGLCKHKTRAELLKEKALGITAAISPMEQEIFDRGHAAEKSIRPYIASVIGDELFPVVVKEGSLLASLDGITMDDETIFEHKIWNADLATQIEVGELTPHSFWQLEHQLHVTKAKRVIFVCSDGTPDKCVHMEYTPVPGRAEFLSAAWSQFDADLCAYRAPAADPILEKKALMALPALSVELVGKVTTSNLPAYRDSALEFIKAINTDLETDQDFADAEQTVKFCEAAEKNIQDVKGQALAKTASIDELFRSLDQIAEAMRAKRLMLDKLVKSRKEQIRAEIVQGGRNNWNAHVNQLNATLRRVSVTVPMPDFATAMKGKRTLASLREAVDSVLTSAKVSATQQSELLASRLAILDEVAKDHEFLVRDLAALVSMPTETLSAVVKQRIADHEATMARKAEDERIRREAAAEAERERLARVARDKETARHNAQLAEQAETARREAATREKIIAAKSPADESTESSPVTSLAGLDVPAPTRFDVNAEAAPTRAEIVDALCDRFNKEVAEVLEWLAQHDWCAALSEAA